jgi:hypothetical protein
VFRFASLLSIHLVHGPKPYVLVAENPLPPDRGE